MNMSVVASAVGIGILNKVAVGLLTRGFAAVGKRARDDLFRSRDPRKATNSELYEILRGEVVVDDVSLAALVPLADGTVTAAQLERLLHDHAVNASIQQLVSAVLIDSTDKKFDRIQEAFRLSVARAVSDSSTNTAYDAVSKELFDVLEKNARARLKEVTPEKREPIAEALAHLVLIQATVDVVEETIASLKQFGEKPDLDNLETWTKLYRSQAAKYHGFITPPDFRERNPVALDKIYVPGQIQTGTPQHTPQEPVTLYELIPELDRDVLLGDPGGGKSTATEAIAHHLARGESGVVPFVVILREFAPRGGELSVVEFIELQLRSRYQAESPAGAVEAVLNSGNSIVLFDGLDELLDSSLRVEVARKVEMFSSRYPQSRIFVTSRKVGYKEAKLDPEVFRVNELAGYSSEDVRTYVTKWFWLQPGSSEEITGPLIESFLAESDSISDLRSNPLLLALLCIIYRGQGYLPKNRIGIYEECSKQHFQSWDRSRSIVFDFTFEAHIEDALKHLAYWMFTSANSDDGVLEPILVRELASFFKERAFENGNEAESAAADFIEFCRGRAWVLSEAGTTPEGDALFKFTHRTFMEFFAASQLTRLAPEPKKLARLLLPRVARGEWDIVGQLAIHLINRSADRGAEIALHQMLDSSANRTLTYRDNVCQFVASCLDYLAIAPGLVRKAVNQSLDLAFSAFVDNRRMLVVVGAWTKLAYVENRTDDTVTDEFLQWLRSALRSDDLERVECALVIIDRLPWAQISNPGPQPTELELFWHIEGTALLQECQAKILAKPERFGWIGDEYYLRGLIDFVSLAAFQTAADDLPADFLIRSRVDPVEPGGVLLPGMGWSVTNWLIGVADTRPSAPRHNRRSFVEMSADIGHYLRVQGAPLGSRQQLQESDIVHFFYGVQVKDWAGKFQIAPDSVYAMVVLSCLFAEIAEWNEWSMKERSGQAMFKFMTDLVSARRSGGELPKYLQDIDIPAEPATILNEWSESRVQYTLAAE
jgi:hypothetical protein